MPATEDDFFDTAAAGGAVPGGPIEPSTTVLGTGAASTIAPLATALTVTAPWRDGAPIDPRYTCKGANVSPPLSWSAAPQGTKEIAITLIDEDANFDHWTMAGIKPGTTSLAENTLAGRRRRWRSTDPEPLATPARARQPGRRTRIASRCTTSTRRCLLSSGGSADDMRAAIDDATLATAEVTGTFTGS